MMGGSAGAEGGEPGAVLVLCSRDGRNFIKRDCDTQHHQFSDVVRALFGGGKALPSAAAASAASASAAPASGTSAGRRQLAVGQPLPAHSTYVV